MRADLLGASLEAYANTRPVLHALRLCHKFGRGVDVHVTKLPQELETLIEGYIAQDGREKASDKWVTGFRCIEARCDLVEHYDLLKTGHKYNVAYHLALAQINACRECLDHEEPRACDRRCKQNAEEYINQKYDASGLITDHHRGIVKVFDNALVEIPDPDSCGDTLREVRFQSI